MHLTKINIIKIILLVILIVLGICTKYYHGVASGFVNNHLGGIIYVIFWILFFSLILPGQKPFKIALWVFVVTCVIEFTQLFHPVYLEKLREYFVFRTLLGNSFNLWDIVFYIPGAIIGYIVLILIQKVHFYE